MDHISYTSWFRNNTQNNKYFIKKMFSTIITTKTTKTPASKDKTSKFHLSHPRNNDFDKNGDPNTFQSLHNKLASKFLTDLCTLNFELDSRLVDEFTEPFAQFVIGEKSDIEIASIEAALENCDNAATIMVNLFEQTMDGVLWASNYELLQTTASQIWSDFEYFAIISHFKKYSDLASLEKLLVAQFDYSIGVATTTTTKPATDVVDISKLNLSKFSFSTKKFFAKQRGRNQIRKTLQFYTESMKKAQHDGMYYTMPISLFNGVNFVSSHFEAFLVARFLLQQLVNVDYESLGPNVGCSPIASFVMEHIYTDDPKMDSIRKIFLDLIIRGQRTNCDSHRYICKEYKKAFFALHNKVKLLNSYLLVFLRHIYSFD